MSSFGEKLLDKDNNWPNCFERDLINVVNDNKQKEFHFNISYNILPVRKNPVKTLIMFLFHVHVMIPSNFIYAG